MTSGLVFYPASHRYKLDGAWVPGVTTLLKKGVPAPALMYWSARTVAEWVADHPDELEQLRRMGRAPMVSALKETPWQARDEAAARGTDVHALGQQLVHGQEVEVPEHLAGHVENYVTWLDAEQPEPLWTERPCASRKWKYAGTFDLIARLRGETWLLDLKTARGVYGDNALQLAGYANAEFLNDENDNEVPMPAIERLGVVHIRADGCDLVPVQGDLDLPFKDFLHAAWTGRAADRIKNYMGEPLAPRTEGAA